jgi:pyruvate kinase
MIPSHNGNHIIYHPILLSNEQIQIGKDLYCLYNNIIAHAEKIIQYYSLDKNKLQYENGSRDNLLCYLALRMKNIEDLQLRLADDGLSSLGRIETNVLTNIEQVLKHFGYSPKSEIYLTKINRKNAQLNIIKRSSSLLGRSRKNRTTRIMVTLDQDIAHNPQLLEELLSNGMDIARINLAHGTKKEWKLIIDSIRNAEERMIQRGQSIGRKCRIVMDLSGPKIRIGPMGLASIPLKITVPKDIHGRSIKLVEGFLDSETRYTEKTNFVGVPASFTIAIARGKEMLTDLKIGERLSLYDYRGRYRTLLILEKISHSRVRIGIDKTMYLHDGIILQREKKYVNNSTIELNNHDNVLHHTNPSEDENKFIIGPIKPQPIKLEVKSGDRLLIYRKPIEGGFTSVTSTKRIICSMPEVLSKVEVDHRVLIDDGKIGARVKSINDEYVELDITYPSDTTGKIRSDTGLNFPDSQLDISAITSEDIENLNFIVQYATAVGISYAHSPKDIKILYNELIKLGYPDFGVIAKIETRKAIHNLGMILVEGLTIPNFGILIARGDLAVEAGFENLSLIQEDILCLCEAAHVPVILATQILETLAKSGLPTRAEITDAARGQRAECVMLNKGKYIVEAVRTLSLLLQTEEKHNIKKRQIFKDFTWQCGVFDIDDKIVATK